MREQSQWRIGAVDVSLCENKNGAFKFLIQFGEKKSHCILLAIPAPVRQKKDHRFLFFGFPVGQKEWKEKRKTEYKRRSEREGKKSVGKEKGRRKKEKRKGKFHVTCTCHTEVFHKCVARICFT